MDTRLPPALWEQTLNPSLLSLAQMLPSYLSLSSPPEAGGSDSQKLACFQNTAHESATGGVLCCTALERLLWNQDQAAGRVAQDPRFHDGILERINIVF